ncbi:acetate--CoA ligase [Candidatus Woesearchaeota archaeon CG10_big_fil_rev_8_21_14_0_10_34_12]|nr:MAG: acetate--CoA ligase [Candidatus Woesearchaeota archaeon CG10_big_fil_rev_8_21_14_0_10_34_12]
MGIWEKAEQDIVIHEGKMNIIESCLDRHAKSSPAKSAFIFEDESGNIKSYPYKELQREVNKFANLLNKLEVKQDSRVFIFLPKIPEMYISFLASIKHGSIAAPLFEAFQAEGLELRLERGGADVLVTNKELIQRLKKKIEDMKIIIIDSDEYIKQIEGCSDEFETILKDKKDTATMIFTSSTAGTPVAGVNICHYALVQQHYTGKLVLALKPEDRYWCTAHPGWVTGSIYGIIAPLSIGCTSYVYEAHFSAEKWINFLLKNRISVLYTAPTALRMLKPEITKEDLKYLKNLCSVGEALTNAVFDFYKTLGIEINDTYWQTETGAMVICSWPGLIKKHGSMGKAIPGITSEIINQTIHLRPDFPSIMTSIYKHKQMYKEYFADGWFKTNDMAEKDEDGYFFFIGRKDDIIKTAGERVSPIEIESILMKHKTVKEAAVIGVPDEIKGSVIKAFIVLNSGFEENEQLKQELSMFIKQNYAGHSYPKQIEFVPSLPKTNSGKIIRAALRKI